MIAKIKLLIIYIGKLFTWIASKRRNVNRSMKKIYSEKKVALISTIICALASIVILFLPRYLGVANDSMGSQKMSEYGLQYIDSNAFAEQSIKANEYFTKQYQLTGLTDYKFSASTLVFVIAKFIDGIFTHDRFFDVRFLALVYFCIYMPIVYFVIKAALRKIKNFSEALVISAVGVLIFSDISYIAYMNSLYENSIILICIMAFFGAGLAIREERADENLFLLIAFISALVLMFTEKRFFMFGIVLAAYLILMFRYFERQQTKIFAASLIVLSLVLSTISIAFTQDSFDETAKYHSMTRGVLLNNDSPVDTLEKMGIGSSYSLLAGSSLYDYYPITEIDNSDLQKGFLDSYGEGDILIFYLRSPLKLFSMWNLGIKSAMSQTRSYCGNYEIGAGMPAGAKSVFWSAWSLFKQRSLPSTIGYFAFLIIIYVVLSLKNQVTKKPGRDAFAYLMLMGALTLFGILDLTYIIIKSGDAQMVQYQGTMSLVMDLLLYGCLLEGLKKLNILEEDNE